MQRRPMTLVTALVVCWIGGCSGSSQQQTEPVASSDGPLTVYVVNYPLQYFAERIGGNQVRVVFPAPADQDPAYWMPDSDTIRAYQQADLVLLNGASYAKWIRTVSLPASKLVDTSRGFADRYIEIEGAVSHTHGPGGEHSHAGLAFTTWLDPQLALAQADAVRQALAEQRPQRADLFQQNFAELAGELTEFDVRLLGLVGQSKKMVVFSHPVFQYLTRKYELNTKSVHWEPDAIPTAPMWDELAVLVKRHQVQWMIWEGEPLTETTRKLSELGVQSVVFDPCANVPRDGDYLTVMERNIASLEKVFAQ